MIFSGRKALFLGITIVLGIILCGAAAATTEPLTSKNMVSAIHGKDLVVTSVDATKVTAKGQKLYVKSIVKNQGDKTVSKGFYTYIYLVPSKTMVGYKKYIGKQYISWLTAGKTSTKISCFIVPTTLYSGSYYIAAKTDATSTVGEANEFNNVGYTKTKTIIYPKKIDSGVSTNQGWKTKYYWDTYLDSKNFVKYYTHFYNPTLGRIIYQKHTIGLYNGGGFPPNCIYYSVIPKYNGQSSYMTIMGGVQISPQKFYWTLWRKTYLITGSICW